MQRRLTLGLAAFFLAVFIYDAVVRLLLADLVKLPAVPGGLNALTGILMLFSLSHAAYALGWRHSLVFFAFSAVISWAYEQAGVGTGLVYGPYHYTEMLGAKLGHVPVLIPVAWFMMIYPSYVIANLIADGRPTGTPGGLRRIAWLAFLSALVMTAWDLVVDPVLSGPAFRAWIWEGGGPYFGVPVQNFVGWLLTTFTVYLAYRLVETRLALQPAGPVTVAIAAMPLVAYGSMMIANLLSGGAPDGMVVIAPFVMGLPLAAAASRLVHPVDWPGPAAPATPREQAT